MEPKLTLTEKFARLVTAWLGSDASATEIIYPLVVLAVYFVMAALGAALAEMLVPKRGPYSSIHFWHRFFPTLTETAKFRCDFLSKTLGGALIAMVLVEPATERQALTAGLGWAAALTAFLAHTAQRQTERTGSTGMQEVSKDED